GRPQERDRLADRLGRARAEGGRDHCVGAERRAWPARARGPASDARRRAGRHRERRADRARTHERGDHTRRAAEIGRRSTGDTAAIRLTRRTDQPSGRALLPRAAKADEVFRTRRVGGANEGERAVEPLTEEGAAPQERTRSGSTGARTGEAHDIVADAAPARTVR